MPVDTGTREIDRKLHRIVLDAISSEYPTAIALGRALEHKSAAEFAYHRAGKTEYARALTIADYVLFARDIGLLDGKFDATRPKSDVRSLDNFQQWLANVALRYLTDNNASLDQIKGALEVMLSANPHELPTLDNVHKALRPSLTKERLRLALKVVSLLRPKALRLLSRRLVLVPGVFVG